MIVKQIWVGNSLRNFNYLIACEETGDALVVDPSDVEQCLRVAAENDWRIRKIVNTHDHDDHTSGNAAIAQVTGAKVFAHHEANIPNVDTRLASGCLLDVGTSVELVCLETPGHTMSHVCLLADAETPALFSGDNLFNAGVGNCHHGGDPQILYQTFASTIATLQGNTLVFPGHDYLENNLRFTLAYEPDNPRAAALLEALTAKPGQSRVTTIALEREINAFMRLQSASIISSFPELGATPTQREVFLALREARDRW